MATISETLAIAVQHHQAGQIEVAEHFYRQVLAVEPNQADALHLLGVVYHQIGKHDIAVETIRRAIRLNRTAAAFHSNLGEAYRALHRIPEAVASYRRAVELKPDYAEAHYNLGLALQDLGEAEKAVASLRQAVKLKPDYAEAHNNLGRALQDLGKLDEAIVCHRRALELKPDYAEASYNLGNALKDQGKLNEAVLCYRRAARLNPDHAEGHNNLGNALRELGKLDEALACFRRALELKPEYANAHNNLGNALNDQGRPEEAVACYRRAVELNPDYADAHSNLLLALQYCTGVTPAALADAHAEYDRRHAMPLRSGERGAGRRERGATQRVPGHPEATPRLRLGFVSPDLGRHPVGYFLIRVLENLSPELQQTFCYSDRIVKDEVTSRIQAMTAAWRDVHGMTDQRLAERIRADRIDVLFDLAGHTGHNRLLVFARRAAPVQITWLGYVGTTGLRAMDYILADRHLIPAEAEPHYCEKVLRMPDDYACYSPPTDAPPPGPLPAMERGYVTFGSFNNLCKITRQVIEVWAGILHRVPRSRLVIRYRGLDDAGTRQRFLDLFAERGIAGGRLDLVGWSPFANRMDLYNEVDVGLDPFPYSGATTTCDALWMGVPVITCPGSTFASRQSLTHILTLGLDELVAGDVPDYLDRASRLSEDLSALTRMRADLRRRMAASPLCDGKRFAENLTFVLHNVWEQQRMKAEG